MLLIFEKAPVQYRAPLYAAVEALEPDLIHVVYETEGAVAATADKEFGGTFAWDIPLLEGYSYTIADANGITRWKLIWNLIKSDHSQAVLLTGFDSWICRIAFSIALLLGKPVWIRMETQDQAFQRSALKALLRSACYHILYSTISKGLFIGALNKEHYINHGFRNTQLRRVPYIVANPLASLSEHEKRERRTSLRNKLGVVDQEKIISFFGKLIPKKQPDLLLKSHRHLSKEAQNRVHYLFVGSGELEPTLRQQVKTLGCKATFTGFINQSKIHDYYLASDLMCLPSRQMGETWGLTVNEGLQAGCTIICSEHVGSSVEFGHWERVRVCKSDNTKSFASCVSSLIRFDHDFNWCKEDMELRYSVEAAAKAYQQAVYRWGKDLQPFEASAI